jgi:hypothetical protein
MLVAHDGAARPASRALKAAGLIIGESTLRQWKESSHKERYEALREKHLNDLEPIVLEQTKDNLAKADQVARLAIDLEEQRLLAGDVKDAAASAQKIAMARSKLAETDRLLRNEPTVITQVNGDDVERQLADFAERWSHVLDGEAEEIPPLALVEGD